MRIETGMITLNLGAGLSNAPMCAGDRECGRKQFATCALTDLPLESRTLKLNLDSLNMEHTPMLNRSLLIFLCLFAAQAAASDDPLASLKAGQPGDVKKLIDRLAGCAHWSGEEPYDAERKTEISLAMKNLRCDRLEKDEAVARKRYSKRPAVLKVLQQATESS